MVHAMLLWMGKPYRLHVCSRSSLKDPKFMNSVGDKVNERERETENQGWCQDALHGGSSEVIQEQ